MTYSPIDPTIDSPEGLSIELDWRIDTEKSIAKMVFRSWMLDMEKIEYISRNFPFL